jgi:hypothetical protein
MAQYEVDTHFLTEIRDPVPAMHAFNPNDNTTQKWLQNILKLSGAGWDFFVNAGITLLIDDANVECFGV